MVKACSTVLLGFCVFEEVDRSGARCMGGQGGR